MKKLFSLTAGIICASCLMGGVAFMTGCNNQTDNPTGVEPDTSDKGSWTVSSPDGSIKSEIVMDSAGELSYSVKKGELTVLEKSALGLTIEEDDFRLLSIENVDSQRVTGEYENITGKHDKVTFDCNETTITFKGWNFYLDLTMRAYDDGYAFRYGVRAVDGSEGTMTVLSENTEFALPANSTVWAMPFSGLYGQNFFAYEETYNRMRYDDLAQNDISMPMLYKLKGSETYSLITESGLIGSGFYGSFLREAEENEGTGILQTVPTPAGFMIDDNKIAYPFTSPWRMGITGDLGTVVESELVEKVYDDAEYWKPDNYDELSEQEKKTYDYDWVEPGVTAWDWLIYLNITSQNDYTMHRRYVNLAQEMGWKYIIVDGGWNSGLNVDDFIAFVKEANEKGVKIIVWCNSFPDFGFGRKEILEQKLDLWKSWGVSGIKIDFFDGQNSENPKFYGEDTGTIAWYETIYQECAKREMIVNCHGCNKPTGERRVYPNVLNREAIRGNENTNIDATVTVNQLFTRAVVGPSDFTPVVNPFTAGMTMAQNMALAILFECGTPSMADFEYTYTQDQIIDFYKNLPARHDDTKFLGGELDSYYVGAVRAGENWFVGGVNSVLDTMATVDFSFLDSDKTYEAEIFVNDPTDNKAVLKVIKNVKSTDKEVIDMFKNGGFAIRLTPKA